METTAIDPAAADEVRAEWQQAVEALMNDVRTWAVTQGWVATPTSHKLSEEGLDTYTVRGLRIMTPLGELVLEPIARLVIGAQGRVDMFAYPSLYRVMLLRKTDGSGHWVVRTDFGPRWPNPWGETTFGELAEALLDEA
jgi:hypothetical protein